MKTLTIFLWIARIAASIILFQTLFFKFSAAPESVYIFTTLGIEPVGRIGSGVAELIASVLLLIPRYSWIGAFIGFGMMAVAIASHLFKLGIEVRGDHGQLFTYALIVFFCSIFILIVQKQDIKTFLSKIGLIKITIL